MTWRWGSVRCPSWTPGSSGWSLSSGPRPHQGPCQAVWFGNSQSQFLKLQRYFCWISLHDKIQFSKCISSLIILSKISIPIPLIKWQFFHSNTFCMIDEKRKNFTGKTRCFQMFYVSMSVKEVLGGPVVWPWLPPPYTLLPWPQTLYRTKIS